MNLVDYEFFYYTGILSGDSSIDVEKSEEDRRASFVDSLLKTDGSVSTVTADDINNSVQEHQEMLTKDTGKSAGAANPVSESMFGHFSLG